MLKDLVVDLRSLLKWDTFALHLHPQEIGGIEVTRIKMENKGEIEAQKGALYEEWLRVDIDPSWETIVSALESANELVLAEQIRTKWLKKDWNYSSNKTTSQGTHTVSEYTVCTLSVLYDKSRRYTPIICHIVSEYTVCTVRVC